MEHSTQPSSGPKVSATSRIATADRPSSRKFSCKAPTKNSFSGIDGDGGRGMTGFECQDQRSEDKLRGRWTKVIGLNRCDRIARFKTQNRGKGLTLETRRGYVVFDRAEKWDWSIGRNQGTEKVRRYMCEALSTYSREPEPETTIKTRTEREPCTRRELGNGEMDGMQIYETRRRREYRDFRGEWRKLNTQSKVQEHGGHERNRGK